MMNSIVKDVAWFGNELRDLSSFVTDGNHNYQVHGIGEVSLPTRMSLVSSGDDRDQSLLLSCALYVPDAPSNLLAGGASRHLEFVPTIIGGECLAILRSSRVKEVACFRMCQEFQHPVLVLSNPPLGPVITRDHQLILRDFLWPMLERQTWARVAAGERNSVSPELGNLLTQSQQQWVNAFFESEAEFMRVFNLNIIRGAACTAGRHTLSVLMDCETFDVS
jgi:hypothetical protein